MIQNHSHTTKVKRNGLGGLQSLDLFEVNRAFFLNKTYLIVGERSPISISVKGLLRNLGAVVIVGSPSAKTYDQDSLPLDVRNIDVLQKSSKFLAKQNLFLDGIINCAGIAEVPCSVEKNPNYSAFQNVIETNLVGTYNLFSVLLQNLNSPSAFIQLAGGGASGPMKFLPAYSSSKAGVVRLIETLASEFSTSRVRLNCLGPGAIKSNMTANLLSSEFPDPIRSEMHAKIPGRGGFFDPAMTAIAVSLLLSNKFENITGKFFSAQWDDWSNLDEIISSAEQCSDSYSLRRILCDRIEENSETKNKY